MKADIERFNRLCLGILENPSNSGVTMRQFNNEHGARAGFNTGTIDLAVVIFEFMTAISGIEPSYFVSALGAKIHEIERAEPASMIKAARILPLKMVADHLSGCALKELREKYGFKDA